MHLINSIVDLNSKKYSSIQFMDNLPVEVHEKIDKSSRR